MLDKNVQMMDAGMRLFETEKPYGTVLGGIKTEMAQYGKVSRTNEIDRGGLPEASADCDLLLDKSSRLKSRYISCKLEDAGIVGRTEDGEEIRCYAASLKEGNRNTKAGISTAFGLVAVWGLLGWIVSDGGTLLFLAFFLIGLLGAWFLLRPDKRSVKIVERLLESFSEGK